MESGLWFKNAKTYWVYPVSEKAKDTKASMECRSMDVRKWDSLVGGEGWEVVILFVLVGLDHVGICRSKAAEGFVAFNVDLV